MKKKLLYIAGVCAALSVGTAGCASSAKAATETDKKPVQVGTETGTDTAETEHEAAVKDDRTPSGPASDTGKAVSSKFLCVYGPVSEVTSDSVTIDNQSGFSSPGEMVITFSAQTPIFDAQTGNPVDMTEAETGAVLYAYIGDAMTMSEPPITNGQLFFLHVENGTIAPVYTEIQAVEKNVEAEGSVIVKAENGMSYKVTDETRILPYLTRNIVTIEDLKEGVNCAVWADAAGNVSRMILFQK